MNPRTLEVRLFGRAAVRWGGDEVAIDARPRCIPLLAKLLLSEGEPIERRRLATLLWPDDDPERARANLRRHLHWLSRRLPETGEAWIVADLATIRWNGRAPWRCDAVDVLAAVRNGEIELEGIPHDEFLAGIDEPWVVEERSRLRSALLDLLASGAIVAHATGAADRAEALARRALAVEPFDERALRVLMAALADRGRRNEALATYLEHERRCRDELDAPPEDETVALAVSLREGGRPRACATNLVPPADRFFGRVDDLRDVAGLLGARRLVTIGGPGGIGKTRLATEAALRQIPRHPDGVFLADLSSIAAGDADSIASTIAAAAGISLAKTGDDGLIAGIGRRRMLLVLDNAEHVREGCARITDRLLRGCAGLRILATSREPLGVPGEAVRRLGPMGASEAARCFAERARDADAAFVLDERVAEDVAKICARLDGIPLAIELAAARMSSLDTEMLARALERELPVLQAANGARPQRHRTLDATIAWTLDLLDGTLRARAVEASIFRGSFDALLADAVLGEGVASALADRSLLHYERAGTGARFRMLEPIRLALARLLAPDRRNGLAATYARAVIVRVDETMDEFRAGHQVEATAKISADAHHVRAALAWAIERGNDYEAGLRLVVALAPFWSASSAFAECIRWGEPVLAHAPDVPTRERGRALQMLANARYRIRDLEGARSAGLAALAVFERLHDGSSIANLTNTLGVIALSSGLIEEADSRFRRARALAEARDDADGIGMALVNLAAIALERGANDEAIALIRRGLEKLESTGNPPLLGWALNLLAGTLLAQGAMGEPAQLLERSLGIYRSLGNLAGVANALHDLGDIAYLLGDAATARAHYGESLRASIRLEDGVLIAQAIEGIAAVCAEEGDAERAALLFGGAGIRLSKDLGGIGERTYQFVKQKMRDAIEARIGTERFEAVRADGELLTDEELIRLALEPGLPAP